MSVNIISVTLIKDADNLMGFAINGKSDKFGDCGIYVSSIMEGNEIHLKY